MNGPPVRFEQQLADERLLDALGRDEPKGLPDGLAQLLADWRADLTTRPPAPVAPAVTCVAVSQARAHRRRRRTRRLFGVAAAAAVFAGGGVTVASAASAGGPESPLWPVTQLIYPAQAEAQLAVLDVEAKLAEARSAVDEQRHASAAQLLAEAESRLGAVQHPDERRRLLAELAQLRAALPPGAASPDRAGSPAPLMGDQPATTPAEAGAGAPVDPAEPGEQGQGSGDPEADGGDSSGGDSPGSQAPPTPQPTFPSDLRPSLPPHPGAPGFTDPLR